MRRLTPEPLVIPAKAGTQPGFPLSRERNRGSWSPRTRVVMDYVVELTREISALLAQGAEVLT